MQFCRRGICVNTGCAKSPRQPVARGSPWPRAVLAHIAHRPIRSTGARPVARPGPSGPKRDQPDSPRAEKFYDRHGLSACTCSLCIGIIHPTKTWYNFSQAFSSPLINSLETRVWVIDQALKTKEMEQFLKIHYTYKNTSILTILHENKIELMHNGIIKTWTQYHEYFF